MDNIEINTDLIKSLEVIIPFQNERLIRIICKEKGWEKKEIINYLLNLEK